MARMREVYSREWTPLRATSAGVLDSIVVSARALVAELGAWDAAGARI